MVDFFQICRLCVAKILPFKNKTLPLIEIICCKKWGRWGLNEKAYSKELALKVISDLKEKNLTILGGDVYLFKKNKTIITYDSWYFEPQQNKDKRIVENSYLIAKQYISNYPTTKGQPYFSVVISPTESECIDPET